MYRALDVPADADLSEFSRLLWQHDISHRVMPHEGRQVLLIARQERIAEALDLFRRWQRGELRPAAGADGSLGSLFGGGSLVAGTWQALRQTPLTLLLVGACIALLFLAPLDRPTALTFSLLYPDFAFGTRIIVLQRIAENFAFLDLLRMLSPILLHGGALHLVFNMLWLWELGRRIEILQSSLQLGAAIVTLALVSNTAQYLYGGGNNFGGMSGVVYGLFAYVWMWQLLQPRAGLALPVSLLVFMLLSLAILTVLELDMIANQAHLGGFGAGLAYGAVTAMISRTRQALGESRRDRNHE